MKYNKWIFIVTVMAGVFLTSCNEDALSDNSIFDTETPERNEFDNWLLTEYVDPYNINFKYRFEDKESDQQYNLVPAEYGKSVALAKLVKFLWLQSYEELMDDNGEFIKTYCPKIITLIGSKAYNPDSHSVVLGTAEGGLKVVLYNVNELDTENPDVEILNEWYFYQHDGIHTGTAVIRTVFFFNQIINKVPIDCFINQSQHMVLRYHVIHGKHHHLFSFFICIFRHHKKHRPSDIYYIRKAVPTIAKPCKSRALSTV